MNLLLPLPPCDRGPRSKLFLLAAITLSAFLVAPVYGADPPAQATLMPAGPDHIVQADTGPPVHITSADTGFWFLTTHSSPQSWTASCPRFCPGVCRYEEGMGFRPADYQELLAGMEPGVPVCILIHGSFVNTAEAYPESRCIWNWLRNASMGRRMQFIYFSWPSYSRITPFVQIDVNVLGRRAARNGYYLAELISHLPPECPVCMIGHSHGSRVSAAALHLMAGGRIQGICHPYARANGRPIRTVFTASAIDHQWFNPGKRYDRALCSTQCLLNMTNSRDPALRIYPLRLPLLSHHALGLRGLTRWDRNRLGGYAHKVLDYDVSGIIGPHHMIPYYFHQPRIAVIMHNYVYFPDMQTAAPGMSQQMTLSRQDAESHANSFSSPQTANVSLREAQNSRAAGNVTYGARYRQPQPSRTTMYRRASTTARPGRAYR